MNKIAIFMILLLPILVIGCSSEPITSFATADGNALGPEDAKVVVYEFSDYDCPYCARAEDTVYDLIQHYGDEIRFEYKHFVVHPSAFKASEASMCAADQEMFWEYHKLLFENQHGNNVFSLRQYAIEIGLDMEIFDECLLNGEKTDYVNGDIAEAKEFGLEGTPSFVINGVAYPGLQPVDNLIKIIDVELAKEVN